MALNERKRKELYDFYAEHGFQNTTEIIVDHLKICHKTFFNRYGSKTRSMEIAWQYWQQICENKWKAVMENCNHSVEELMMTLYSIDKTRFEYPYYHKYTRTNRKYLEQDSFFFRAIRSILEKGKQFFHFQEELDINLYTSYVLNNLFLVDTEYDNRHGILQYLLTPALTERGMELFQETPFA